MRPVNLASFVNELEKICSAKTGHNSLRKHANTDFDAALERPALRVAVPPSPAEGARTLQAREMGPQAMHELLMERRKVPLNVLPGELRRRYPSLSSAEQMATTAEHAGKELYNPSEYGVRFLPEAQEVNQANFKRQVASIGSWDPTTLGHELGHFVAEEQGTMGGLPAELEATESAIKTPGIQPRQATGIMSATTGYLVKEKPHLQEAHRRYRAAVDAAGSREGINPVPLANRMEWQKNPKRTKYVAGMAQRMPELAGHEANYLKTRANPFVDPLYTSMTAEERAAVDSYHDLLAKELEKKVGYGPEFSKMYRQEIQKAIENPTLARFKYIGRKAVKALIPG